ncbi:unnamed protein product [Ectocarpus sp. 12 AP-2014]
MRMNNTRACWYNICKQEEYFTRGVGWHSHGAPAAPTAGIKNEQEFTTKRKKKETQPTNPCTSFHAITNLFPFPPFSLLVPNLVSSEHMPTVNSLEKAADRYLSQRGRAWWPDVAHTQRSSCQRRLNGNDRAQAHSAPPFPLTPTSSLMRHLRSTHTHPFVSGSCCPLMQHL